MNPTTPIQLDDPDRPVDPSILDAPGGFVWWYIDAVDARGDGVVLIWSFGLPFLPGVLARARAGVPLRPRERPSLNVVGYRGGEEAFYLLQTYDDAAWSGDTFRFGASTIEIERRRGRHFVRAALDCPVPRSEHRLRGTIELVGPAAQNASAPRAPHPHLWTPLTGPARLRSELTHGGRRYTFAGRAYHDRNVGTAPLDALGIGRWSWGRTVGRRRTSIHYLLWDEDGALTTAWLVDVNHNGHVALAPARDHAEPDGVQRRLYGMPHPPRTELVAPSGRRIQLEEREVVDEGPFYLRSVLSRDGRVGVAEHVVPSRIDRALHRPLVRMRVHATEGPCSVWLPLFSGPSEGRVRRLFGMESTP